MKQHIDIVKSVKQESTGRNLLDDFKQSIEVASLGNISPIRSSRQRMADARNQPQIDQMLGAIWMKNELHFLFADTGLGKSILAVTIADSLSKGNNLLFLDNDCPALTVLYYDFELSDRQFRKRYTDDNSNEYEFRDNFLIDNIDFAELMKAAPGLSFDEVLFTKIKHDIRTINPHVIIVDNLTFLSTQTTQKTEIALETMRLLTDLKKQFDLSILVLAHTPKIDLAAPLSINSMAGSKQLVNFADSVSAIGRSKQGKNIRYIKQIKPSRSSEVMYDIENVITCEIVKDGNFLTFEHVGFDNEHNHLKQHDSEERKTDRKELIERAKAMKAEGKTLAEIAFELLGNEKLKGTIYKWVNKEIV
jgi:archaellum biogenesis ATPase FlaH